eukprot:364588-Chlamydomonas_euryale.AAC.21
MHTAAAGMDPTSPEKQPKDAKVEDVIINSCTAAQSMSMAVHGRPPSMNTSLPFWGKQVAMPKCT